MDPTQALIDLLDRLNAQDREGSIECLESLAEWLQGMQGFFPDVPEAQRRFQQED